MKALIRRFSKIFWFVIVSIISFTNCLGILTSENLINQNSKNYLITDDISFTDSTKTKNQFLIQSDFFSHVPSKDMYLPSFGNRTLFLFKHPIYDNFSLSFGSGMYYSRIKTLSHNYISGELLRKSFGNFFSLSLASLFFQYDIMEVPHANIYLKAGFIWDILIYDLTKTHILTNGTTIYGSMFPFSDTPFFNRFSDFGKTSFFNIFFSIGMNNMNHRRTSFGVFCFAGKQALHAIQSYSPFHFGVSLNYLFKLKNNNI